MPGSEGSNGATVTTQRRCVVLLLDDSKAWSPINFADMFIKHLSREGEVWHTLRVASGEDAIMPVLLLAAFDTFVLTGSRFNCRDGDSLTWFADLLKLIRGVAQDPSKRLYGGCFGCQAVAAALGGRVDYNPTAQSRRKFILLAETIKMIDCPTTRRLLKEAPSTIDWKVLVSHGDCVHELPPESELVGFSESCAHEIFVAGEHRNILAAQSHPEFDFEYAIRDRIWPAVVEKNERLDEDEAIVAQASFQAFGGRGDGSDAMMAMIQSFLTS